MKKFIMISILVIAVLAVCLTGMVMPTDKPLNITAESVYLTEYESGNVLHAKNEDAKRPIASMVKIMTLLLTFEKEEQGQLRLEDKIVVSHNAAKQTGSEMFLDENVEYSISDIIKGVVLMSANDGAVALGETVAGSEEGFVAMMNERAKSLGMENTLFSNPTGLPSESEQYSTAKDVNIMTRELLKHKKYYDYSKIWLEDYTHPSGRITQLANTNKLIRFYKGCDSGKTGYTDEAKYCLSASAERGGMRIVGTVMGADNSKVRFAEMSGMFNYGFGNYKKVTFNKQGESIGNICAVKKGKVKEMSPVLEKELSAVIGIKDEKPTVEYEINENITAPIAKGQVVGKALLKSGDKVIKEVNLVSSTDINKATLWDNIKNIFKK